MLILNPKAQCNDCKHDIKVKQPDGTELTEHWRCNRYANVPNAMTVYHQPCRYYEKTIEQYLVYY